MTETALTILELLLFFITVAVIFKAFNSIDTSQIFKKGSVWEIQIFYTFGSVIFAYLFVKAILNVIELSLSLGR